MAANMGLYLHVPFCRHLCHYCDFAKTANYSSDVEKRYWQWLQARLEQSLSAPLMQPEQKLSSVFLGGGTPSLYTREWVPLFQAFSSRLYEGTEISIEANPDDITLDKLAIWRELGINRISLGVQSFQEAGLRFLTRQHSAARAVRAVEESLQTIGNVNVDLIYGWPGQSRAMWLEDLQAVVASGATHISLYNLTYEGSTPFARRLARGKLEAMADEDQAVLYHTAREYLGACGFEHQEVSNWAKAGMACRHNWIYWTDEAYLGLGLGAHGYVKDRALPWGVRYHFTDRLMTLLNQQGELCYDDIAGFLHSMGASLESDRDADAWILETIGCGLRSLRGVSISKIEDRTSRRFQPAPAVKRGLEQGQFFWSNTGELLLSPEEWFRETRWSLELALSFSEQIAT